MARMTKKARVGNVIEIDGKRFVVEEARMDGGGGSVYDRFPDGWHATARALKRDGTYNPRGRIIDFYQSGSFTNMRPEVKVVGQAKVTFVNK